MGLAPGRMWTRTRESSRNNAAARRLRSPPPRRLRFAPLHSPAASPLRRRHLDWPHRPRLGELLVGLEPRQGQRHTQQPRQSTSRNTPVREGNCGGGDWQWSRHGGLTSVAWVQCITSEEAELLLLPIWCWCSNMCAVPPILYLALHMG